MGFLQKLWDETLAGPAPESGLEKLRKYNSFAGWSSSSAPPSPTKFGYHNHGGRATDDLIPVSRSITILRSNSITGRCGNTTPDSVSAPSSPAFSSPSNSPFAPSTPRRNYKKQLKGKTNMEPSSSNYDWIVLSSWDR
ncbi:unnamed protein product [Withania somnifera]